MPAFQQDAASGGGGCLGGVLWPGFRAFWKKVHFLWEKLRFFGGVAYVGVVLGVMSGVVWWGSWSGEVRCGVSVCGGLGCCGAVWGGLEWVWCCVVSCGFFPPCSPWMVLPPAPL